MTPQALKPVLWLMVRIGLFLSLLMVYFSQTAGPSGNMVERLEYLGAVVHLDDASLVSRVEMTEEQLYPDVVRDLSLLETLKTVLVRDATIDDFLLDELAELPGLKTLCFANCRLNGDQLARFSGLRLQGLSLSGCRGHSLSLQYLADQADLQKVDFSNCPWFDDEDAKFLSNCRQLRIADLSDTGLSDEGMRHLSACPELYHLSVSGCGQTTEQGFDVLRSCPMLRILEARHLPLKLSTISEWKKTRPDLIVQSSQELAPDLQHLLIQQLALPPVSESMSRLRATPTVTTFRSGIGRSIAARFDQPADFEVLQYLPQLLTLRLSGPGVDDSAIRYVPAMTELQMLDLAGSQVTPKAVASLPVLSELHTVSLAGNRVSATVFQWLSSLPGLRRLDLTGAVFEGDLDLPEVLRLPSLVSLDVSRSPLARNLLRKLQADALLSIRATNADLQDLDLSLFSAFPELQDIDLSGNPLNGTGLGVFRNQPLRRVIIRGTQVTDKGLQSIAEWGQLPELLDLSETPVTGIALSGLRGRTLRELRLAGSEVSDSGLRSIGTLRSLEVLDVRNTSVTPGMLKEFEAIESLTGLGISGDDAWLGSLASSKLADRLTYLAISGAASSSLSHLAGFRQLQGAVLESCDLDPQAAQLIIRGTPLHNLTLDHCKTSPEAVQAMANVPRFFSLTIRRMDFLKDSIVELQRTNPGFRVYQDLN